MIKGRQIRAGRALINFTADELAKQVGMATPALLNIETGAVVPRESTVKRIIDVMGSNGVEFTPDGGVRPKPSGIEVFEGPARFDEFYDFLYVHLRENGGDVCLSIADETVISKYRSNSELHFKRMKELKGKGGFNSFRVLANKSTFTNKYSYSEYRRAPDSAIAPGAFYTFGDCLALMSFSHDPAPYVVVLRSAAFAETYRKAFNAGWESAEPMPSFDKRRKQ